MTPSNSLLAAPPTIAILLAKLQRAVDEERRENSLHRSGCRSDCQEHFRAHLLADIPEDGKRVIKWC
jgi:hypothetical protein